MATSGSAISSATGTRRLAFQRREFLGDCVGGLGSSSLGASGGHGLHLGHEADRFEDQLLGLRRSHLRFLRRRQSSVGMSAAGNFSRHGESRHLFRRRPPARGDRLPPAGSSAGISMSGSPAISSAMFARSVTSTSSFGRRVNVAVGGLAAGARLARYQRRRLDVVLQHVRVAREFGAVDARLPARSQRLDPTAEPGARQLDDSEQAGRGLPLFLQPLVHHLLDLPGHFAHVGQAHHAAAALERVEAAADGGERLAVVRELAARGEALGDRRMTSTASSRKMSSSSWSISAPGASSICTTCGAGACGALSGARLLHRFAHAGSGRLLRRS